METRDLALEAVLAHVPRLGWSRAAVEAGLADLGEAPETAALLLPRGPLALINAWAAMNDRRMTEQAETADLSGLRTPARIRAVFALRLALVAPHRQALRHAAGLLATPCGLPTAFRLEARAADAMWKAAGDSSTGFSRHTRRATLAAIHAATMAYWMRDDATTEEDALAFFDRRLASLGRRRRFPGRASDTVSHAA